MKKIIINITLSFFLCVAIFASPVKGNPDVKFVKGNIQDKISSIKEDSIDYKYGIAVKAVDFVITNIELLKDDREFAGLAIAAVYSYPEKEYIENTKETIDKFGSIFYSIKDENVKLSVLDKLSLFSEKIKSDESVAFINTYLKGASEDTLSLTSVEKKAIQILAKIGDHKSFDILYASYKNNIWPEYKSEIKNSLIALSEKSTRTILGIIKKADFEEMKLIYTVFIDNSSISSTLKSEIAENLLSNSMILIRDSSKITKELSLFQLNNCNVLYQNSWTRSSPLLISYFDVAKSEYKAGLLTSEEFEKVILYLEKTASKESVKVLSAYLEELNKETENGSLPAVNIVSAVIQALGNLGDKSAFDCLLFTTYLSYPEDIVAQARRALSSLKW